MQPPAASRRLCAMENGGAEGERLRNVRLGTRLLAPDKTGASFLWCCKQSSLILHLLYFSLHLSPHLMTMASLLDSAGSPPPTIYSSFPQNSEDFDADPRISFSKVSNKFILETEHDGAEYEFDDKLKRWVPVVRFYLPFRFA